MTTQADVQGETSERERIARIEDSARNLVKMWEDPIKVAEHLLDLLRRDGRGASS